MLKQKTKAHEAKRLQSVGDSIKFSIDGVQDTGRIERFGPAPNITVRLLDGQLVQIPTTAVKL